MNPSQRIVLNTVATYTRSVIAAGLALFSTRWVLTALGPTDFGLFSVIGSLIAFISFLCTSMGSSVSRYFAYSIGQQDKYELNKWFNAAIGIHLLIAIILITSSWLVGEFVIANVLNIPSIRISASLNVYRISLLAAFVGMITIPFYALFVAKQRIYELAVWGTIYSLLIFFFAYILNHINSDRLIFYAYYMAGLAILIQCVYVIRAMTTIPECTLNRHHIFDSMRWRRLMSFTSWHTVNGVGFVMSNQGIAILLNLYFGPRVNAAYGIANQVSAQAGQLSTAMIGALSPEIAAREGFGDRERMIALSNRASKFSTVLALLFVIPVFVEMDYLLKLWLKSAPDHTAEFCGIMLLSFAIDKLSVGSEIAINAVGRIAVQYGVIGTLRILTLPMGYLFLIIFSKVSIVITAILITNIAISIFRIYWMKQLLNVPYFRWIRDVFFKCMMAAGGAIVFAMIPYWLLQPSYLRALLVLFSNTAGITLISWFFVLDVNEKFFISEYINSIKRKFAYIYI